MERMKQKIEQSPRKKKRERELVTKTEEERESIDKQKREYFPRDTLIVELIPSPFPYPVFHFPGEGPEIVDTILNKPRLGPFVVPLPAKLLLAIDCEMVGVGKGGAFNSLARVSIVDVMGVIVFDTFVEQMKPVTDYRTHVTGFTEKEFQNASPFHLVQLTVAQIIHGKILVGHALDNDLQTLHLTHPKILVRDSAHLFSFRKLLADSRRQPSLKGLVAHCFPDLPFRTKGFHDSIEDARVSMRIYVKHWMDYERSIALGRMTCNADLSCYNPTY